MTYEKPCETCKRNPGRIKEQGATDNSVSWCHLCLYRNDFYEAG